jgi:hypothetical protein
LFVIGSNTTVELKFGGVFIKSPPDWLVEKGKASEESETD